MRIKSVAQCANVKKLKTTQRRRAFTSPSDKLTRHNTLTMYVDPLSCRHFLCQTSLFWGGEAAIIFKKHILGKTA